MAGIDELRKERLKKLEILKGKGINPYPARTARTHSVGSVLEQFDAFKDKKEVVIAGRIMAIRGHGGLIFCDVYDGTGKIQGYLRAEGLGDDKLKLFEETVDIGDFVELRGTPTITKRGEQSVLATNWVMLTKSLRPLPEKWHGITDDEERLRKRYLDILFNEDVREMVERRARFWASIRQFMTDRGFLEVQTPALETMPGGAEARPFETHHHAFDIKLYLRISAGELWQKELLVAGFPKIFELGRIFRNEGVSGEHFQDYTQMEFYWAYADYKDGMKLTEELFKYVAQETWGTLKFEVGNHTVDFVKKWEQYDYRETIKKMTEIDVLDTTLEEVKNKLKELGVDEVSSKALNLTRAIDMLWKHCRRQITGPGFLTGVPKVMSPLAKSSHENPEITERFQTIIGGTELSNGFSELNDPLDQRERFEMQQKMREAGDVEAHMKDESFLEAMEYGMPPACGFGLSERVFSVLSGLHAREAQIFPLMKPKE